MAVEEAACDIPINTFRPEIDDLDDWFSRYELAVVLATNETDDDQKIFLYKSWLPLKLDDSTRMLHSQCTSTTWAALKKELKDLLITPEERYNWRAGRKRIMWNGKDSFHVLAAKVKRSVDMYDDQPRESDYFHNFRLSLPLKYQQAIDWESEAETLDEAKRIAFKCQAMLASGKEQEGPRGAEGGGTPIPFIGASLTNERLNELEEALQRMSIKVDNLTTEIEQSRKSHNQTGDHSWQQMPSGGWGESPSDTSNHPRRSPERYHGFERKDFDKRYPNQANYSRDHDFDFHGNPRYPNREGYAPHHSQRPSPNHPNRANDENRSLRWYDPKNTYCGRQTDHGRGRPR